MNHGHGPDDDDRKPDDAGGAQAAQTADGGGEPGSGDGAGTGDLKSAFRKALGARPGVAPKPEPEPGTGTGTGPGTDPGTGPGTDPGTDPAVDEMDLRLMLHRAVADVEPREGTLEHLRRAVPARRTRKRQAAVGMAAAALFVGTAVPALLHVTNAVGSSADPSIAGNASQAQGGAGQNAGSDSGKSSSATSSGQASEKGGPGAADTPEDTPSGAGSTVVGGKDPSSAAAGVADCSATQLGGGTTTLGAPDSTGTVYGSFRISNISTTGCTVTDAGTVTLLAQGAADATRIGVAQHVAGDPATGLPDSTQESARLLLLPGAAYEVKFAWVPSETCPAGSGTVGGDTGGTPSPAPSPSGDSSSTTGTSTGGDTGLTEQLAPADGTVDGSGSVGVSLAPQAGAPEVTVTLTDACAGTVYRTGVLPEA